MRNFNKTFRANVEAVYNKINSLCNIYYDRRHSEAGTEDDANIFFYLTAIRRHLLSIMEHNGYPNIKTVFHEFVCLSESIHQIQSFINDDTNGEELGNAIKEVSSLIDPQMLSVDVSVYESNIVSDYPEDGDEIVLDDIWMNNTPADMLDGVFNHLRRLGYLSRRHQIIEEFDEDGEFEGVILNFGVYKNKAEDLADFLKVFSRYAYNTINEYDFGWEFGHIANMILHSMSESRKYKNTQLTQYIYNSVVYGNPNPFGESKMDNK